MWPNLTRIREVKKKYFHVSGGVKSKGRWVIPRCRFVASGSGVHRGWIFQVFTGGGFFDSHLNHMLQTESRRPECGI